MRAPLKMEPCRLRREGPSSFRLSDDAHQPSRTQGSWRYRLALDNSFNLRTGLPARKPSTASKADGFIRPSSAAPTRPRVGFDNRSKRLIDERCGRVGILLEKHTIAILCTTFR